MRKFGSTAILLSITAVYRKVPKVHIHILEHGCAHTHNLKELHGAVPDGWSVSNITQYDFGMISEWVITGRYPSGATLTKKDAIYGINAAQAIHESVKTDMKQYESS